MRNRTLKQSANQTKGELTYANGHMCNLCCAARAFCRDADRRRRRIGKEVLQQGMEAYNKGDFDSAIACSTEAIRLDRKTPKRISTAARAT